MSGQPPIVWDRAEGVQVYDRAVNKWLDWSSGVVVANAGHAAGEVREPIRHQVDKGLVAGLHLVKAGTQEPDGDLAFAILDGLAALGESIQEAATELGRLEQSALP